MFEPISIIDSLLARLNGPLNFRFILQPLMAAFFAFRDGRSDAQQGKAPFLRAISNHPEVRRETLLSAWKSIGKVFLLAIVLDLIAQYLLFHELRFRGGAIFAGVLLALIPYILLRGPAARFFRARRKVE